MAAPIEPSSSGKFEPQTVLPGVDPCYYLLSEAERNSDELLELIIKIKEIEPWRQLSFVKFGSEVFHRKKGYWIVTARVPTNRFLELREMPFVISTSISCSVYPI